MVTDQSDIRDIELRQDIDSPLVLFLHAELGIVSSVYDEIDCCSFLSIDIVLRNLLSRRSYVGYRPSGRSGIVSLSFVACFDKRVCCGR